MVFRYQANMNDEFNRKSRKFHWSYIDIEVAFGLKLHTWLKKPTLKSGEKNHEMDI